MKPKSNMNEVENQNPAVFEDDPILEAIRDELDEKIQLLLKDEIDAALGAGWYQRVIERIGYRNGSVKRTVNTSLGKTKFNLPRARILNDDDSETEWDSKILPNYQRRCKSVDDALISCYLSGASTRRIKNALGPLLKGVPMSRSTISRLVKKLKKSFDKWETRSLKGLVYKYIYADAINIKTRAAGKVTKLPVLVVIGVKDTGEKELLALAQMGSESTEAWTIVMRGLVDKGLNRPLLVIIDGNAGLRNAIETIWPGVRVQRCAVHKWRNIFARTPKHAQEEVLKDYRAIVYAKNGEEGKLAYNAFVRKWSKTLESVVKSLEEAGEELLTFYQLPEAHWKHLRSTNVIERANLEFRRRTKTQGSLPSEESVLLLLFGLYATGQIRMQRIASTEELKNIEMEKILTNVK